MSIHRVKYIFLVYKTYINYFEKTLFPFVSNKNSKKKKKHTHLFSWIETRRRDDDSDDVRPLLKTASPTTCSVFFRRFVSSARVI